MTSNDLGAAWIRSREAGVLQRCVCCPVPWGMHASPAQAPNGNRDICTLRQSRRARAAGPTRADTSIVHGPRSLHPARPHLGHGRSLCAVPGRRMAQRARTLAAAVEHGLRHHRRGLRAGPATLAWLCAVRHLVSERDADRGPLDVPVRCRRIHAHPAAARLVAAGRRLAGHAGTARRPLVVQGNAGHPVTADRRHQLACRPAAAPTGRCLDLERGRGAAAFRAAGAWSVLPCQGQLDPGAGRLHQPGQFPRHGDPGLAGRRRDGDHAVGHVHDRHRAPPPRGTHRADRRPRPADRPGQPPCTLSARTAVTAAGLAGQPRRPAADRHRPLQAGQRPARPRCRTACW